MNNEPVRQLFSYAETGRVLGLERSAIFKRVRDGRIKTVTLPDGSKRVTRDEIVRLITPVEERSR